MAINRRRGAGKVGLVVSELKMLRCQRWKSMAMVTDARLTDRAEVSCRARNTAGLQATGKGNSLR